MVRPHQQTPQKQQPMETESQGKELGTGGVGGRVSNSLIHGNSTGLERTDRNFRHSQSQANTGKTAHLRTQQLNKLPARDKAMTEGHSRTKWLTPGRGKPRAAADCLWQNHEGHEGRGASFEHCVQMVWIPVRNGLGRLTTFQMHDRVSRLKTSLQKHRRSRAEETRSLQNNEARGNDKGERRVSLPRWDCGTSP